MDQPRFSCIIVPKAYGLSGDFWKFLYIKSCIFGESIVEERTIRQHLPDIAVIASLDAAHNRIKSSMI